MYTIVYTYYSIHDNVKYINVSFLGCPECYPKRDTLNPGADNKPMEELYKNTQKKVKYLKDRGFEVVEKWDVHLKKN